MTACARVRHRERRRLREAHQLDAHVDGEGADQDRQQGRDDDDRRERQALARRGEGLGDGQHRLGGDLRVAALPPPLADDVLGVEAEVERVVAQEALRVDGARQLAVLAVLEGGEVAGPDLGVALGPVEVHALALAGREQALRQRRTGLRRVGAIGVALGSACPPQPVSRRHASSSCARALPTLAPVRGRRRTAIVPPNHRLRLRRTGSPGSSGDRGSVVVGFVIAAAPSRSGPRGRSSRRTPRCTRAPRAGR